MFPFPFKSHIPSTSGEPVQMLTDVRDDLSVDFTENPIGFRYTGLNELCAVNDTTVSLYHTPHHTPYHTTVSCQPAMSDADKCSFA